MKKEPAPKDRFFKYEVLLTSEIVVVNVLRRNSEAVKQVVDR